MQLDDIIRNGENSYVEFKEVDVSPQSLAEEVVAFLNVRGGTILIGVTDEGRISGIDSSRKKKLEEIVINICITSIDPPIIPIYENIKLQEKWIVKVTIPEGIEKPYRTVKGKYLIRVGSNKRLSSREELLRLFQNAMIYHIDDRPIVGTNKENLDLNKIVSYFKDVYELQYDEMDSREKENLLLNSSILARLNETNYATIAGLLFFAKKGTPHHILENTFPHAGIQFVAYEDNEMERIFDRYDCFDSCPEAVDSVVHKIRLNWKVPSKINGLVREETAFPMTLFRELIVNAIVHRDYSIKSNICVRMFPDHIDVVSPGRLANTVTIEKMKAGTSIARNPILLKFMQNYRYADQLGRGIPMILRTIKKMPGFSLQLSEGEEQFHVTIDFPQIDT